MPDYGVPIIDPHQRFASLAHRVRTPRTLAPSRPVMQLDQKAAWATNLGPWLSQQACSVAFLPYLNEQVKLANARARQSVGQNDAAHYFETGYEAGVRDLLEQIKSWRSGHSLIDPDGTSRE